MAIVLSPSRASLGGTSIIMACACGAASSSVKLAAMAGLGATTKIVHPVFFGIGAALMLYGLWRTARASAYLGIGAFALIGVAAWITPPGKMTMKGSTMAVHPGLPWDSTLLFGAALYIVGIAVLAYAFWRAFPSRKPAASATAMGGIAVATGCTCCLVTGAVAGMAFTAGASVFETTPILFWGGLAAVAVGLYRLGGMRAAILVPVGGVILKYGPDVIKLAGDYMVGPVNLRFIPSYLVTVAGAAVITYGFAVAYRRSQIIAEQPVPMSMAA